MCAPSCSTTVRPAPPSSEPIRACFSKTSGQRPRSRLPPSSTALLRTSSSRPRTRTALGDPDPRPSRDAASRVADGRVPRPISRLRRLSPRWSMWSDRQRPDSNRRASDSEQVSPISTSTVTRSIPKHAAGRRLPIWTHRPTKPSPSSNSRRPPGNRSRSTGLMPCTPSTAFSPVSPAPTFPAPPAATLSKPMTTRSSPSLPRVLRVIRTRCTFALQPMPWHRGAASTSLETF